MIGLLIHVFLNFNCFHQKSIAESIGESVAYLWSSFSDIGVANTFSWSICIGIDYTLEKYC